MSDIDANYLGLTANRLAKIATELKSENTKLLALVNGLTWCCEHSGCDNRCPLYDKSEPDHCRETLLKQALGIKAE